MKSNTSFIKFGVPQGSILGPKLFCLYVNDFTESITSGELYMFADDTTIFTVSDNIDILLFHYDVILPYLVKRMQKYETVIHCSVPV